MEATVNVAYEQQEYIRTKTHLERLSIEHVSCLQCCPTQDSCRANFLYEDPGLKRERLGLHPDSWCSGGFSACGSGSRDI